MTLLYGAASPLCDCWRICCAFIGCSQMWHFRTRRGCRWTIIRCYAFSIGLMRLGCYRKWGWHRNSSFYIHIQNYHCTAFKGYKGEMVFNGQRPPKLVLLMPTDVPSRAGIRFDVKKAFLHGVLHQVFELRGRKGKFSGEKGRYMVSSSLPRAWFEIWSLVMTKIDGFPEKGCWSFRVHKKETKGNYCSPSVLSLNSKFTSQILILVRKAASKQVE